jgi:hypothetical protein
LQELYIDISSLLIAIGEQLRELAFSSEEVDYKESTRQLIDFLLEKGILFETVIYKEKCRVIKESLVMLFPSLQFDVDSYRFAQYVL